MIVGSEPFKSMLNDADADLQLRAYLESLRYWLDSEQSSWRPHWSQLSRFFLPRNQRFVYDDVNQGQRMDQDIVDNTPTLALRTLRAGMMGGMSNPSREWFKIHVEDHDDDSLEMDPEVQDYLERGADEVREAMLRSNFYPTLHNAYGEMALYGTQAFCIEEDVEDDIRCFPYPIGSYFISGDASLRVDLLMRVWKMTARQMVQQYGYDNVSSSVKSYVDSNAGGMKEQWWPVVHIVHPRSYYGSEGDKYPPWVSVHYELATLGQNSKSQMRLLKRGGYFEMPIICSRWEVTGENFYGNSPCMEALGDAMSLQLKERRKAEAIDKMVKPPMVASPAMANAKMSILPGDITFGDMKDGSLGFKPAFEMKYDVNAAVVDQREVRERINEALYKTMFLMISGSDRREVTAEEIRAKQEEKMLVLGPVLERCNNELFAPAIKRIWGILRRRGKIPNPPAKLKGRKVSFEFESIIAQAQRMMKIASIDRWAAFVGQQAAIDPSTQDIVNRDEMNREYAANLAVPVKLLNTEDAIGKIRQQRAQQQQMAQQADMAQKLAPAAAQLSQADTSSDNALTRLLGTVGQSNGG